MHQSNVLTLITSVESVVHSRLSALASYLLQISRRVSRIRKTEEDKRAAHVGARLKSRDRRQIWSFCITHKTDEATRGAGEAYH